MYYFFLNGFRLNKKFTIRQHTSYEVGILSTQDVTHHVSTVSFDGTKGPGVVVPSRTVTHQNTFTKKKEVYSTAMSSKDLQNIFFF